MALRITMAMMAPESTYSPRKKETTAETMRISTRNWLN